jgi:hypothetical protein
MTMNQGDSAGNSRMSSELRMTINTGKMLHEAHKRVVIAIVDEFQPSFLGSGKVRSISASNIRSEADLMAEAEALLQASGQIRQNAPVQYWRVLLEQHLLEVKERQLAALLTNLAYVGQPAEATRLSLLRRFVAILTGRDEAEELDVMVTAHFLWQIKRKMTGLPVTWHMMPVVWGRSGAGKSVALSRLMSVLGGYVLTGMALDKVGDDRYYRQFAEHLVVFLDEMPKVEKASIEHIKQVITAGELTGRLLYSNSYKSFMQRCTFIGTSNEAPSQLIKDSTGMRRFHYIKCADEQMDWEGLNKLDMASLWREVDERREEPYIIAVMEELKRVQNEVRVKDALEEFITEGFLTASKNFASSAPKFKAREAYLVFRDYCEEAGYSFVMTKQTFNKQLVERYGFVKVANGSKHSLLFPSFYGTLTKMPGLADGKGL